MSNIVVLTFHTVTNHKSNRPWAFLSTSVSAFENTLKYLKKKNYQTITLKELYEWKKCRINDNQNRVLIHFDDGFLDNYTIAYPMLKKYGFCATVFISPEFVDPRPIIRETQYENIKAGKQVKDENVWGYMSWEELKKVDREGVIDVQAHAMTHTWYQCGSQLVDWHHKNDSYYWLCWNIKPDLKPFWLTQFDETIVPYGTPIFTYAKSISTKIFYPRDEVVAFCLNYYKKHNTDWNNKKKAKIVKELNRLLYEMFGDNLGRIESNEEFILRLQHELVDSKINMEEHLGKKIEFLAWPGGAVSEEAYKIAKDAGYLAWTKKGKPYNEINDDLYDVYRLGGWSGIKFNNNPINILEYCFLKMQLHRAKDAKNTINRLYAFIGNLYRKRHIDLCQNNGEKWK